MDAILVSCTKAPFFKSGFAANLPLPSPGYTSKLVSELIIMVEMVFMKMKVILNWSYSALWMSVVKPKPKQLRQPIKFSQEPMKTLRKNKQTARNAGKTRPSRSWFKFWIWLDQKVARVLWANHTAKTMQSRIPSTLSWKLLTLYRHSHFLTNFWYPFVHSGVPGTILDPTPV